jgi:hypothetical protein
MSVISESLLISLQQYLESFYQTEMGQSGSSFAKVCKLYPSYEKIRERLSDKNASGHSPDLTAYFNGLDVLAKRYGASPDDMLSEIRKRELETLLKNVESVIVLSAGKGLPKSEVAQRLAAIKEELAKVNVFRELLGLETMSPEKQINEIVKKYKAHTTSSSKADNAEGRSEESSDIPFTDVHDDDPHWRERWYNEKINDYLRRFTDSGSGSSTRYAGKRNTQDNCAAPFSKAAAKAPDSQRMRALYIPAIAILSCLVCYAAYLRSQDASPKTGNTPSLTLR